MDREEDEFELWVRIKHARYLVLLAVVVAVIVALAVVYNLVD